MGRTTVNPPYKIYLALEQLSPKNESNHHAGQAFSFLEDNCKVVTLSRWKHTLYSAISTEQIQYSISASLSGKTYIKRPFSEVWPGIDDILSTRT